MKLVKRYAAWTIWQLSEDEYKVYLPEDHPDTADPEFECGSVKELIGAHVLLLAYVRVGRLYMEAEYCGRFSGGIE